MSLAERTALHGAVTDQEDVVDVDEIGQVEQMFDQPLHLRVLDRRPGWAANPRAWAASHMYMKALASDDSNIESPFCFAWRAAMGRPIRRRVSPMMRMFTGAKGQSQAPCVLDGPGRTLPLLAGGLQSEEIGVLVIVHDPLDAHPQVGFPHHQELHGLHIEAGRSPAGGLQKLVDQLVRQRIGLDSPMVRRLLTN